MTASQKGTRIMVDDEPPFTHHLKVRPYRGIEKAEAALATLQSTGGEG